MNKASSLAAARLVREMFSGQNLRPTVILLTSAGCVSAWNLVGNYRFWSQCFSESTQLGGDPKVAAAVCAFCASLFFLALVPVLVLKFALRDNLADYGVQLGSFRFTLICCVLVSPLLVLIGYVTAQSPTFQAVYPINPMARDSGTALAWHLVGQLFWYAAWEFHFRGFLQHGLEEACGSSTAICVQTLASTLAHIGKPGSEVFGAIIGGLLWGALAWRTRSLLGSTFQHWLLGASLDFFIFRRIRT